MGFHGIDLIIVVAIGLLIMGPKAIQSISRQAGKTVGQAKSAKDKLLAELPMEDLDKVRNTISRIPLSPQQAAQMLLTPEQEKQPTTRARSDQAQSVRNETHVASDSESTQAQKQDTSSMK